MGKATCVVLSAWFIMGLAGTPHTHAVHEKAQLRQGEESVTATVQVGDYPHGVAVNGETHRVYVANLNGDSISVIDDTTSEVIATIEAAGGPRDVAVNPRTDRVYITQIAAHAMSRLRWLGLRLLRPVFAVSVIDGRTHETLAHVRVGTNPWLIEVSEITNRIYVANYGSYDVSVIDGQSHEVIGTIEMGPFRTPGGLAVNEETNRVYIVNTLHLGPLDFGPGRLVVVDGETHEVLNTLRVGRKAHVAVDEGTNRVYVTSRQTGTLSVIDGHTYERIATVEVGPDPYGLAVSEETHRVYVANHGGRSVSVIDGEKNELLYTVGVGASPVFLAVNEATGQVYVTNSGDDTVSVLDAIEEVRR